MVLGDRGCSFEVASFGGKELTLLSLRFGGDDLELNMGVLRLCIKGAWP